jgi:type III pantothenate kinase
MKTLVLDIGNTNAKLATFNNELLEEQWNIAMEEENAWNDILDKVRTSGIKDLILSSTKQLTEQFLKDLKSSLATCLVLDSKTNIPITNKYSSPETLGVDRIAAAVGANAEFPNTNLILFDLGTCITMEFVNSANCYLGGYILPGYQMNFDAMHHFTDKLPALSIEEANGGFKIGDSSKASMQNGVEQFIIAGLEGIITKMENKYGMCRVILTGGDAKYFETKLKSEIFVHPNLVLKGLNKILTYNVS